MLFEVGLICNTAFDKHIFNTDINSKASTYDSQLEEKSVLFLYRKNIRQSTVCLSSFQVFFFGTFLTNESPGIITGQGF